MNTFRELETKQRSKGNILTEIKNTFDGLISRVDPGKEIIND